MFGAKMEMEPSKKFNYITLNNSIKIKMMLILKINTELHTPISFNKFNKK